MQAAGYYMNVGDYAAAIPHFQAATRLNPRAYAWIALGDAALLAGQLELAQKALDRAWALDPGNGIIIRSKGQLLIARKKLPEAERLLEGGLKRYPNNTYLRAALGNLYLVTDKPRKAVEVLRPAVEQEPTRVDLRTLLGEALGKSTQLEAAVREMREAVRLQPSHAEAWGRIGLYLLGLTRYQEARESLQQAITLEPMRSHYYWAIGDSYFLENNSEENFRKATQYYRQALNLEPTHEKALYSYGLALTRRGRPEDLKEALRLFQRLARVTPDAPNIHFKMAELSRALGRTAEAKKHQARFSELFRKGRERDQAKFRSAAFVDTGQAHLLLARKAMARQDYALAVRELQLALERDPGLTAARTALAEAQKRVGQPARRAEAR